MSRNSSCGCVRFSGKRKTKKPTSSRYKGVCWSICRREWNSQITNDGRLFHLGWFKSERQAALAYDAAAVKMHGDDAATNARLGLLDWQKSGRK